MGRWAVRWRSCSAVAACSAPSRSACCGRCSGPASAPTSWSARRSARSTAPWSPPTRARASTDRLVRLWASPEAGDRLRRLDRPAGAAVRRPHPPALAAAAAPAAGARARRALHVRRSEDPVPVLRGQHRAGRRALVRQRAAGRRGARVVGRAGAAAADADRRRALRRRRHRQLDPDRRGGPGRRQADLRAAGGPDRAAADRAAPAVGGGAGGVRDRPAAPVRPGACGAARRCARCTCFRPAAARARDDTPWAYRDMAAVGPPDQPRLHRVPPLPGRRTTSGPSGPDAAAAASGCAGSCSRPPWSSLAVAAAHHAAGLADRRGGRVAARARPPAGAAGDLAGHRLPGLGRRRAGRAVRALGGVRLRLEDPLAGVPARPLRARPARSCGVLFWQARWSLHLRRRRGRHRPGHRAARPAGDRGQPARRPGRLVHPDPRAGQLVRPGAADRAQGHAAVGSGGRRAAQPAAQPVHLAAAATGTGDRWRRRSASWPPASTTTTRS